jgi:uncharacterized protein HemX
MPDSTPSWPTPGDTPPSGDAPTQPVAPPPDDAPTQPAVPPTEAAPTVPGGPPPSPPPTVPVPGGPSAPSGKKGGIPTPVFVVVLVLLVAALAFGIVSFLGKNSESDDKDKAQDQLAQVQSELDQTRNDLASLQDQLEGTQQTGEALSDLVQQAAVVADDLKACTDASRSFASAFIDAVPGIISSGEIPQDLSDQADNSDSLCATSDESYQELIDIFNEINS